MMAPTYILDTAKVILACELSQQPAWRGSSPDDPQLIHMAEQMLCSWTRPSRAKFMVDDAIKTAWAVHRHLRPKMHAIVEKAWHASQFSDQKFTGSAWAKMQDAIVSAVFYHDEPQYVPPRRLEP
jgi:hypothetical protein